MNSLEIPFVDNIVDIGIRIETRLEHYPIVRDYYDPKFYFPEKVRTFCTNSGNAHVVRERYATSRGDIWYSVNGHAFAADPAKDNGLVNFALLRTVRFTAPLASGQAFARASRPSSGIDGRRKTADAAGRGLPPRLAKQGRNVYRGSV